MEEASLNKAKEGLEIANERDEETLTESLMEFIQMEKAVEEELEAKNLNTIRLEDASCLSSLIMLQGKLEVIEKNCEDQAKQLQFAAQENSRLKQDLLNQEQSYEEKLRNIANISQEQDQKLQALDQENHNLKEELLIQVENQKKLEELMNLQDAEKKEAERAWEMEQVNQLQFTAQENSRLKQDLLNQEQSYEEKLRDIASISQEQDQKLQALEQENHNLKEELLIQLENQKKLEELMNLQDAEKKEAERAWEMEQVNQLQFAAQENSRLKQDLLNQEQSYEEKLRDIASISQEQDQKLQALNQENHSLKEELLIQVENQKKLEELMNLQDAEKKEAERAWEMEQVNQLQFAAQENSRLKQDLLNQEQSYEEKLRDIAKISQEQDQKLQALNQENHNLKEELLIQVENQKKLEELMNLQDAEKKEAERAWEMEQVNQLQFTAQENSRLKQYLLNQEQSYDEKLRDIANISQKQDQKLQALEQENHNLKEELLIQLENQKKLEELTNLLDAKTKEAERAWGICDTMDELEAEFKRKLGDAEREINRLKAKSGEAATSEYLLEVFNKRESLPCSDEIDEDFHTSVNSSNRSSAEKTYLGIMEKTAIRKVEDLESSNTSCKQQ